VADYAELFKRFSHNHARAPNPKIGQTARKESPPFLWLLT